MAQQETPELKRVLGAMVFGANRPLSRAEMRKCLLAVAEEGVEGAEVFRDVRGQDITLALKELGDELQRTHAGFHIEEVAGGFRLQSDASCGRWLKQLLDTGKPQRLSQPALETLAIVAYRQPVTRSSIEAVRGVSVDHMVKLLTETQLVRICGRSTLPGRPFLYGTTQLFLEHFGLKSLDELSEMEPMLAVVRQKPTGKRRQAKTKTKANAKTGVGTDDESDLFAVRASDSPDAEEAAQVPDDAMVDDTDAAKSDNHSGSSADKEVGL